MFRAILVVLLLVYAAGSARAPASDEARLSPWFGTDSQGGVVVDLYFFWTYTCPHCLKAAAFLSELEAEWPWLRVHRHEVVAIPANAELFAEMAESVGEEAQYVPAVFICGRSIVGFDGAETTGARIRALSEKCRSYATQALSGDVSAAPLQAKRTAEIPLLGTVSLETYSLPLLTLVLAGLNAFNPCSFFVLLFLLSLLVHAHSHARMAIVGGAFVLFSGVIYFLFMAAWLNFFMVVGQIAVITTVAGLVALAIGILNVKDFLRLAPGVSLHIPESAKPKLFARMRQLVQAANLPLLLSGTAVLAIGANLYAVLCTAGFPMVYTRALTLQDLSPAGHYLYLALYNVIYVIPLAAIVAWFAITLGTHRLTEREGRLLKLVSGLMMLGLGTVLVVAPGLMVELFVPVGLVAFAVAVTAAAAWRERHAG
ncbi:glutaredoxin family protein [Ferruginivarius sediminum]|uniref:Glutaredoxin n=1 Tax=Ferruginivarius sediminum TaxID=2661937 RepID=A0A369TAA0_9PROT|nr:glutaredoxin domain-containing protein [Ferruginivarius sediminum]RDD62259.1 glutaredoxin [Ferruginivarius sediminum]